MLASLEEFDFARVHIVRQLERRGAFLRPLEQSLYWLALLGLGLAGIALIWPIGYRLLWMVLAANHLAVDSESYVPANLRWIQWCGPGITIGSILFVPGMVAGSSSSKRQQEIDRLRQGHRALTGQEID